jgi:EpsI family protein
MPSVKSPALKKYGVVAVVCLILAFQAAAMRRLNFDEEKAENPGLHTLPMRFEGWNASHEELIDPNTEAYLKPDEYILRDYVDEQQGAGVSLFAAYFKSLQSKYGPHSPRICLPGAGWLVSASSLIKIPVPGRSEPLPVNEFSMEKSNERILVLYWYQNDRAVWAEEYYGKLRLLPDLIRYRRSDVSLVRLISPIRSATPDSALAECTRFTKDIFPLLAERFSSVHSERP